MARTGIHLEMRGIEQLVKTLGEMNKRLTTQAEKAVIGIGQDVMGEAQQRVPVVTGRLRSSAFVRTHGKNQYRTDLHIGYAAPYAVYVHEIPFSGHTTRGLPGAMRNGKGYKWLERAARAAWPKAIRRATERLGELMRRR